MNTRELNKLNAAAELLIDTLPGAHTKDVLKETAQQLYVPMWMYIAGLIQRAYDTGEHTAPTLDPVWTHANPAALGDVADTECQLETCHVKFRPRWPGQLYHSTECGNAAARIARDRAHSDVQLARYAVGEEPEGVAKSCINIDESCGDRTRIDSRATTPQQLGGLSDGAGTDIEAAPVDAADPIAAIERISQASMATSG